MVRFSLNSARNSWKNYLPDLEAAPNNRTDAATGHTPIFLANVEHSLSLAHLLIIGSPGNSNEAVNELVEDIRNFLSFTKASAENSKTTNMSATTEVDHILSLKWVTLYCYRPLVLRQEKSFRKHCSLPFDHLQLQKSQLWDFYPITNSAQSLAKFMPYFTILCQDRIKSLN